MMLAAGRRCYLNYGFGEWHGRMILDHVASSDYVVATPEFDVFVEQMDGQNADLEGFRVAPTTGGLPVGVPGNRESVYDFDDLTDADIKSLIAEGKELGAMERAARSHRSGQSVATPVGQAPGLGPSAHPVPPPAVAGAVGGSGPQTAGGPPLVGGVSYSANLAMPQVRIAGPFGMWVLDEPTASYEVGTEFASPSDALELHGRALALIDGGPAVLKYLSPGSDVQAYIRERKAFLGGDPRVLPVPTDSSTFPGAVEQMRKVDRGAAGLAQSPLSGPETAAE